MQADPNPMQNVPKFSGKHYDHHQTSFLQAECRNSLESFVSEHDEDFIGVGNRKVMYFDWINFFEAQNLLILKCHHEFYLCFLGLKEF